MPLFGNEIVKKCRPRSQRNFLEMFSGVYVQRQGSICEFSGPDAWVVLSPIEQSIKRKIESVGKPLRDWNINIFRGVLTGYNEAFIITTERRDEILSNCKSDEERQRTDEIIRPYLLCVLNSPLSEWFFSKLGTTTGVGTIRWKKYTIEELLIPKAEESIVKQIECIVDKYLNNECSVTELSSQANYLLYKAVGLSKEEISYVENYYPPLL